MRGFFVGVTRAVGTEISQKEAVALIRALNEMQSDADSNQSAGD
jgi:hypothetical protein